MLQLQPVTFKECCRYIEQHHSHHGPPQGHKFSIAVNDGKNIVGIVIIGRPVNRNLDNGWTAEVTRCCTNGMKNVASMLYAAAWRAAKAMGYKRIISYTLIEEKGISLLAAGWKVLYQTKGGSWNCLSRPRIDTSPIGQKLLWEAE